MGAESHQFVNTFAELFVKFVGTTACSLLDQVVSFFGRICEVGNSLVISCVGEEHNQWGGGVCVS